MAWGQLADWVIHSERHLAGIPSAQVGLPKYRCNILSESLAARPFCPSSSLANLKMHPFEWLREDDSQAPFEPADPTDPATISCLENDPYLCSFALRRRT